MIPDTCKDGDYNIGQAPLNSGKKASNWATRASKYGRYELRTVVPIVVSHTGKSYNG